MQHDPRMLASAVQSTNQRQLTMMTMIREMYTLTHQNSSHTVHQLDMIKEQQRRQLGLLVRGSGTGSAGDQAADVGAVAGTLDGAAAAQPTSHALLARTLSTWGRQECTLSVGSLDVFPCNCSSGC